MLDIYKKLCQYTNNKLHNYDSNAKIHFERAEGLLYSVFSYPKEKLLSINDSDEFIRECFYKILDRTVDEYNFNKYHKALQANKISRDDLINELYQSNERDIKQTGLIK
jgi:hypothetical protein